MCRLLVALIIMPGFLLNIVLSSLSSRGSKKGDLDERDEAIALRASQMTLIILALVVYG